MTGETGMQGIDREEREIFLLLILWRTELPRALVVV